MAERIDKVSDKVSDEGEEMARGDIPRALQAVTPLQTLMALTILEVSSRYTARYNLPHTVTFGWLMEEDSMVERREPEVRGQQGPAFAWRQSGEHPFASAAALLRRDKWIRRGRPKRERIKMEFREDWELQCTGRRYRFVVSG